VSATGATHSTPAGGPEADDWDHHWDSLGDTAEDNPANLLRRRLIMSLLGPLPADANVLDIGSGQGELALDLKSRQPALDVVGVEYSAAGVARSRAAAQRAGVDVTFHQMDLLSPVARVDGQRPASFAVCSEVLEHVDDPATLLRNTASLVAPGCRLVVTVPGGVRTAFDRHIGHREHFSRQRLRAVIEEAGWEVERVLAAGFPFFNLYKLLVLLRGERMVQDVQGRPDDSQGSWAERVASAGFRALFRLNVHSTPWGWQVAAVARLPEKDA
jgi:SAM-dependent methyltransferase